MGVNVVKAGSVALIEVEQFAETVKGFVWRLQYTGSEAPVDAKFTGRVVDGKIEMILLDTVTFPETDHE